MYKEVQVKQHCCRIQIPFISDFWLPWLLTPMTDSAIPRHYLLSIGFGLLISEFCAWCWANFSLFCLGCQILTLDGHVNFPFLPQSRCPDFSEFHGNNFWRLYKSIIFLYHYYKAWQMVLKDRSTHSYIRLGCISQDSSDVAWDPS